MNYFEKSFSVSNMRFLLVQEKISVDCEIEYKSLLSQLKLDFEARFAYNKPSPKTGLDGFEKLKVIGGGSFGKVWLVRDSYGKTFAVKTMNKSYIVQKDKVENIMNEKRLINSFRFPFVIWLKWSRKDYECIYLGLPLLQGGDLFSLHHRHRYFTEDETRFYAAQVCLALEYLHYLGVVYRDLKLENIVIDRDGYIRLIDFGSSKRVDDRTMTLCGTPEYMAPELITTVPYFTGPDWWAFGIFIYEMVFGSTPFYKMFVDTLDMYECIVQGTYHMPAKFSDNLKHLIKNLLVVDFTKRLGCRVDGVDEVKQHVWFSNINWCAYLRKAVSPPFVPSLSDDLDTRYFKSYRTKGPYKSRTDRTFSIDFVDF